MGKKCDYTPKNCLTIMKEKPGGLLFNLLLLFYLTIILYIYIYIIIEIDHHGCPFAVFN